MTMSARQTTRSVVVLFIAIMVGVFFPYPSLAQDTGSVAQPSVSVAQPAPSSAEQAPASGQSSPDLGKPMALGPGIFWLGVLLGYFLIYTINVGSKAADAVKSLLGVVGIGGGGVLAVLPTSSNSFDIATKLTDATTKLASTLQELATKAKQPLQIDPQLFNKLAGTLANAAHDSMIFQQQLTAGKMELLSSYAQGAMWGFVVYVILAITLSGLYSKYYQAPGANQPAQQTGLALFAQTLAKTLLGEDFGPAPNQPAGPKA